MPPMKPSLPVLLTEAAATPARYEPSSSRKKMALTLGKGVSGSTLTRTNFTVGASAATLITAARWSNRSRR